MKNKLFLLALLLGVSVLAIGCKKAGDKAASAAEVIVGEEKGDEKKEPVKEEPAKEEPAKDAAEDEEKAGEKADEKTESEETALTEEKAEAAKTPAGEKTVKKGTLLKNPVCNPDDFKNAVVYARRSGSNTEAIDYSKAVYTPGKYEKEMKESDDWKQIEAKVSADELRQIRMLRTDRDGSTIDFTVYTDPSTRYIDKITSCEFCATGREMTQYYFKKGELIYAYRYQEDVYGSTYEDGNLPGKKCYFEDNAMVSCYLNDKDVDFKNVSYQKADFKKMDEFNKTQYERLEEELINQGYMTYEKVANIPGTALISGYVGDEFGGVLSNVKITVTSKANKFSQELLTNGDGYFEARIPVNTDDCYGIVCKYGDYPDSTVDDIYIRKGTTTYSLGVIYMSEEGIVGHDRNTYLLNANYKTPVKIGKGEYCVTLSYDVSKADLKPFAMNVKTQKSSTDLVSVIKPGKDDLYRYYVTDQRGGHSGNPMTYEMSTSQATVHVYDESKLVACFCVPVNHAGVVWEVFSIQNGTIVPSDNYYYEGGTDVFFE